MARRCGPNRFGAEERVIPVEVQNGKGLHACATVTLRPGSVDRMPLKVACQMDPIDRIDIRGDSTFALLLEAQRRGHALFYYTPPHLSLLAGRLIARGATLKVEDRLGKHYE